jgi:hypothetical protein
VVLAWVVGLVLVAATACRPDTTGAQPVAPAPTPVTSGTASGTPEAESAPRHALAVLHEWDGRRSEAFAAGDAAALRRLHVAGSPLAQRDVEVMWRYRERGLTLTRVQQQVASVDVLVAAPRTVTVSVVERLALTQVSEPGTGETRAASVTGQRSLPSTPFARRVLRFELVDEAWRLSWARAG